MFPPQGILPTRSVRGFGGVDAEYSRLPCLIVTISMFEQYILPTRSVRGFGGVDDEYSRLPCLTVTISMFEQYISRVFLCPLPPSNIFMLNPKLEFFARGHQISCENNRHRCQESSPGSFNVVTVDYYALNSASF